MRPLVIIALFACLSASAQMPPAQYSLRAPALQYVTVQATDGTNLSDYSNEITLPTYAPATLTFSNSQTPGVSYVLLHGTASKVYTRTNILGTNTQVSWPIYTPKVPTVFTLTWTDALIHAENYGEWHTSQMHFFRNATLTHTP